MKIRLVEFDNRRQSFRVFAGGKVYELPYAAMDPRAGRLKVVKAFADPELGREAFTYETDAGEVGAVHLDDVLLRHGDPRAQLDHALYELTIEAETALREARMSKRALARRLATSMSQLTRLLDATNRRKSVEQMMALLHVLGRDVRLVVHRREPIAAA